MREVQRALGEGGLSKGHELVPVVDDLGASGSGGVKGAAGSGAQVSWIRNPVIVTARNLQRVSGDDGRDD